MANEINIKLVVDGKEASATLNLTDEQLKQIARQAAKAGTDTTSSLSKIGNIVTGLNQGLELAKKGFDLLSAPLGKAAEMEVLRSAFQGTAQDMELFRKATAGTVTEAGLIKLSNQATDLGVSMKDQAIFFNMAEDAADKYGGSIEENFQKIIYASEGNTKGLKQLGIEKAKYEEIVKSLTQAHGEEISKLDADTQKQIRLQAILIASGQTIDDVNAKQADSKDRLEQVAVAVEEVEVKFGEMILPVAKDILGVLTPAIAGATNNVDLLIAIVETGTAAFVTYQLAVNGTTIATKLMEAASISVKKAIDAIKLAMETNPWGLALAAVAALGVGLYKLNEEYGNTLENQLKTAQAAEDLNKKEIEEAKTKLDSAEKTKGLTEEYVKLNDKLKTGALNADEAQKAKARLRDILKDLKTHYPGIITSTNTFAGSLGEVKKAAGESAKEVTALTGKLTALQQKQVTLSISTKQIEVSQSVEDLKSQFTVMGVAWGDKDHPIVKQIDAISNKIKSGQLSDAAKDLEAFYGQYSSWAEKASGGDKKFNIETANTTNTLKGQVEALRELYKLRSDGQTLPEVDASGNKNQKNDTTTTISTTTSGKGGEDSFTKNKGKTLAEITREHEQTIQKEAAFNMDYLSLIEARNNKKEELAGIESKRNDIQDQKELDALNNQRTGAQDSIKILDDEIKNKEDLNDKEIEAWRANRDKKFELEQKHLEDMKQIQEGYYNAVKFLDDTYMNNRLQQIQDQYQTDLQAGLTEQQANIARKESLKQLETEYYDWKWQKYQEDHKIFSAALSSMWAGYDTFFRTLLDKGMTGKERLNMVWDSIKQAFVGTLAEMAKQFIQQMIAREIVGKGFEAASIASAVGTGTAIASAYAPAAAFASIMTLGGAAIAGSAGLAATTALAYGLAIPKFAEGGLIAGGEQIVHVNEDGPEFVVNADATRNNLEILEAMNAGANLADISYGSAAAEGLRNISIPAMRGPGSAAGSAEGFKMLGDRMENSLKTLGDRMEAVERSISISEVSESLTNYQAKQTRVGN